MSSHNSWLEKMRDGLWPEDRHRRWIHGMGAVMVGGTLLFWVVMLAVTLFTGGDLRFAAARGIAMVGGIVTFITSLPYVLGSLLVRKSRWPELIVGTCGLAMCLDLAERIYVHGVGVQEAEQNFFLTVLLGILFSIWVLLAWGVDGAFRLVAGSDRSSASKGVAALVTVLLIGGGTFGAYRVVREPPPEPLARVEGPEDEALAKNFRGSLLVSTDEGSLQFTDLPSRDTTVLVPDSAEHRVSYADGPSRSGTIAYVETLMGEGQHRLKVRDVLRSREQTLFRCQGDVLWKQAVGPPALSPKGRRVAIVRNPELDYGSDASGDLGPDRFLGNLELWNVETKKANTLREKVRSHSPSWLDEKRLIVAVPDSGAEGTVSAPAGFEQKGLPMVSVLNVETGTETDLFRGSSPLPCTGGETLLVQDGAGAWWQFDVSADTLARARWPGTWKGPIGCTAEGHVVYWGLPTIGMPKAFDTGEGADRVPAGDIKVAMIGTQRFATLVRGSHPAGQWVRFRAKDFPERFVTQ